MLGSFQIFLNILEDICMSRCATGINDTSGKFAVGINDTGGKFFYWYCRCNNSGGKLPPQRHRWQIIGTISDYLHLKVKLKEKMYLYVNSTIQRGSNKITKAFLIEDFSICQQCQWHRPLVYLGLRIFPRILEKFEMALMVYSGACGKLIHEKNLKSKISWHCPFKYRKLVIIDKKANYFHIFISNNNCTISEF